MLLLTAAPASFFAWILPIQVVLSALDSLRRNAKVRWASALLPAMASTVLILIVVENFTRTLLGFGIANSRGAATAVYFAFTLLVAFWMWQSEGIALANGRPSRWSVVVAAVILVIAGGSALASAIPSGQARAALARERAMRRPDILFVGIDGVNAAETSVYEPGGVRMPTLEALNARGVRFENAFSNAGRTYGSVTCLLTGKLPTTTRVIFPPDYLEGASSLEHLPLLLKAAGYTNAQVGMKGQVDANDLNMRGGFDIVNGRPGLPGDQRRDISKARERMELYRSQLTMRVLDRLPHILFIREMHDEYRFLVRKDAEDLPYFADARRVALAKEFINERREPWFLHIHLLDSHGCEDCDSALKAVDASLGELLAELRATSQLDRTLIVVYSDHSSHWGTTVRLPLIIVPPGGTRARQVRNNVQLADVAPTILSFLGLPQAAWMSGVPLLDHEPPATRPIFSLTPFADDHVAAVILHERWATMDLRNLEFRSGTVQGHTAPRGEAGFDDRARNLLLRHLRATGHIAK